MTIQVTKQEAIQQIAELLDKAESGDEVIIEEGVARPLVLRPVGVTNADGASRQTGRKAGLAKGQFVVPDEFFDPLPDEFVDAFYK